MQSKYVLTMSHEKQPATVVASAEQITLFAAMSRGDYFTFGPPGQGAQSGYNGPIVNLAHYIYDQPSPMGPVRVHLTAVVIKPEL